MKLGNIMQCNTINELIKAILEQPEQIKDLLNQHLNLIENRNHLVAVLSAISKYREASRELVSQKRLLITNAYDFFEVLMLASDFHEDSPDDQYITFFNSLAQDLLADIDLFSRVYKANEETLKKLRKNTLYVDYTDETHPFCIIKNLITPFNPECTRILENYLLIHSKQLLLEEFTEPKAILKTALETYSDNPHLLVQLQKVVEARIEKWTITNKEIFELLSDPLLITYQQESTPVAMAEDLNNLLATLRQAMTPRSLKDLCLNTVKNNYSFFINNPDEKSNFSSLTTDLAEELGLPKPGSYS